MIALCQDSDLVVLARVDSEAPDPLPEGGTVIFTTYAVSVDEWIHGPRAPAGCYGPNRWSDQAENRMKPLLK
jgi:hypothetical protein